MAKRRGGGIVGGLVLIGVGLWFLLDNLGFELPGIDELWPVFPLLGGLALVVSYLTGRKEDPGVLVPGCGGFLVGVFFLAITLGPLEWEDLSDLWPVFPVIGGLAFLAVFALGRNRDAGLLVPGCGGLLVGLFFFLFTIGPLDWDDMSRMWPGFPLIGGLVFLAVWAVKRREPGPLIPAGLGLGVGVVGFFFTLGGLGLRWLLYGWPVLVILVGLAIVLQSLVARVRD